MLMDGFFSKKLYASITIANFYNDFLIPNSGKYKRSIKSEGVSKRKHCVMTHPLMYKKQCKQYYRASITEQMSPKMRLSSPRPLMWWWIPSPLYHSISGAVWLW